MKKTRIVFLVGLLTLEFGLLCRAHAESVQAVTEEAGLPSLSLGDILNLTVETASKQTQKLVDAPSTISVMTRGDIEKMGVTSLIDVLKYIPGIETSMDPIGNWRVSIRGVRAPGNILVLINGHTFNDFYDGASVYDFPVAFIDKLEVIRGSGSPLFGTNAVAGIINIFTVKNSNEAKLTAGTNTTGGGDLNYHRMVDGGANYALSAGYFGTHGTGVNPFSTQFFSVPQGNTNRWQKDFYFSGSYDAEEWSASIFGLRKNTGPYVGPNFVLAPDSNFLNTQIIADLSYKKQLSPKFLLTPRVYANLILHDYLIQETPAGDNNGLYANGLQTKESYTGETLGTEIQGKYQFNSEVSFLNGVVLEKSLLSSYDLSRNYQLAGTVYNGNFGNFDNLSLSQKGQTRTVEGYFAEGDYIGPVFDVSAGFRVDHYSDFGNSLDPRAALVYKPFEIFSVKVLYGTAFRAPTFKELYDQTNFSTNGTIGNASLQPEFSRSAEIAGELRLPSVVLRANVYSDQTSHFIGAYDPQGTGGSGTWQNLGTLNTLGFELEAVTLISRYFSVVANFSQFTMTFDWDPATASAAELNYIENIGDHYVTNAPATRANLGFDLTFWKFKSFIGLNYGGKSEGNRRFALEGLRSVQIPQYLQGNFWINYEFNPRFHIQLAADNIGAKKSDPDDSTNIFMLGTNGMVQPEATYLLSANYRF